MYKVAHNNTYGGFGLSEEAINWLEENARQEIKDFIAERKPDAIAIGEKEKERFPTAYMRWWERISFALMYDFKEHGLRRHDKNLIACIEALGTEKASGKYARLVITEIPGNQYSIREYDGLETVETPEHKRYHSIEDED